MPLRCVLLYVKDLPRMTAFYRDALQLATLPDRSSDGWTELDAGGATIGLHAIPEHIARDIEITSPPAAREEGAMKLIFGVEDVESARARLTAHGAVMFEGTPWGACDGLDPEGNVFQISSSA
jgi:predicted enzyme related to lactoylglutathione lyase